MTIKELLEQRAQLIAEARQLTDRAGEEDRDLSDEESANFDKYMADAQALKERVEREEKLQREERAVEESRGTLSDPDPVGEGDPPAREDRSERRVQEEREERQMRAFEHYLCPERSDLSDHEYRDLQADLDTSGGYTVAPPQFVRRLIKFVDDILFFRQMATVIPVNSSDRIEGVSLDTDPADSDWTSEIATPSADTSMAFGGRALEPHKLSKLLKVSDKLLMVSALPVEQIVRERLAYKIARPQENTFLNGNGAGQPLGIFTASDQGISTSRDVSTDNNSTSVTFDGLKSARGTLKPQYRARASWIAHRDLETQVAKLKDGEGQYQWSPSTQAGDPDRLLGFPFRVSELAPNTFTSGLYVAVLGDFSHYWIAELQSIQIDRLVEKYYPQIGFASKAWIDGMPVLEEAFVRVKLG